jgi:hypothetical protein
MSRGVRLYFVVPLVALALSSCRVFDYEQREPWRMEAEERCLAEKTVQPSAFMEPESSIDERGACGMSHPFKVSAISGGYVTVAPTATLACPVIGEVDRWLAESVQSAAEAWFGEQVVEIHQLSAYSCRTMNNQTGAGISEHAFGNALDVSAFKFASGREIKVKDGWRGPQEEREFLRYIFAAACERFSTVLGPGADPFHYDHFHLDLARRSSAQSICKPVPEGVLTPPTARQNLPMARRQAPMAPQGPMVVTRQSLGRQNDLPLNTNAQPPMYEPHGPMVVERQQSGRPADLPLSLTPPQPPRAVNGPGMIEQPSAYPAPDPNRLLPPRNVGAKLGSDPITTGSIAKKKKEPESSGSPTPSYMLAPEPMTNQNGWSIETIEQRTLRALSAGKN